MVPRWLGRCRRGHTAGQPAAQRPVCLYIFIRIGLVRETVRGARRRRVAARAAAAARVASIRHGGENRFAL